MRGNQPPQLNWTPVLAMIAVAALLTFAQHHARSEGNVSPGERAARFLVWPVQSVLDAGGLMARNTAVAAYRGQELVTENERLRQELARLESEKLRMWSYYLENKAMKHSLGWDGTGPVDFAAARVIDWAPGPRRRRVTIESNSELERGNVVRTEAGPVGRVIEAQGRRGIVVLLLDSENAVAAKIEREDGDRGMIYAAPEIENGGALLQMRKLPHDADVQVGDWVTSSGMGEVYPAGIPIGVVERVERSEVNVASITAYVRPFADFQHLRYVRVIRRGE
jgi:rod shape-determining protein MreC